MKSTRGEKKASTFSFVVVVPKLIKLGEVRLDNIEQANVKQNISRMEWNTWSYLCKHKLSMFCVNYA